jgi:hypothetical protein
LFALDELNPFISEDRQLLFVPYLHFHFVVTMQGQKEAPPDMQCKDKFLIQSIVANHKTYHSKNGATTKDITPKMVTTNDK